MINQEMQPTKLVKVCGNINPKSGTWPLNFHGEVGDMHGGLETYMRMEG